jgi:hypothetical protein
MRQSTISHRRLTRIVKNVIDYHVYKAKSYECDLRNGDVMEGQQLELPGISFETKGRTEAVFVTINDEFLNLVGYDGNLDGFLADYFGRDYKPCEGEPLKFRFLEGYLINPTKIEKGQKK